MKKFFHSTVRAAGLAAILLLAGCANWSQMPWQHDYQRPDHPFMHQTNSIPNPDWKAP